jgi:hypothetical protein
MFSEILKIIPRLDGGDLNKLEKNLGGRFSKIAKKFGKGLGASLMGGGVAGLALGLIDKLLNPLKEVNDSIERTLKAGGDYVANAEQFGTTPGKLLKLQKVAQAKGVDSDALYGLITKFQVAVAEAAADPDKKTSVRQFVGQKDSAESFYKFLQGMQNLTKEQQLLVQSEVFGEKQILKNADFFNSAKDFGEMMVRMNLQASTKYNAAAWKLDNLDDKAEEMVASREAGDFLTKGSKISEGVINEREAARRREMNQENYRLGRYDVYAKLEKDKDKLMQIAEKGFTEIVAIAQKVGTISALIDKIPGSKFWRGVVGKGE